MNHPPLMPSPTDALIAVMLRQIKGDDFMWGDRLLPFAQQRADEVINKLIQKHPSLYVTPDWTDRCVQERWDDYQKGVQEGRRTNLAEWLEAQIYTPVRVALELTGHPGRYHRDVDDLVWQGLHQYLMETDVTHTMALAFIRYTQADPTLPGNPVSRRMGSKEFTVARLVPWWT